ncbi:MAG: discoidin domain-containing protein [Phycisphaerae bacterium]|nr:discoidin domain-containing protein [Phycisphaerae bacterium]
MSKYLVVAMCCLMSLLVSGSALGFDATTDPDLVGWWSFSEGEGTTVADLSPYGRNGTLEGGATWAEGRFGGGIELDGSSGYVSIPDFELTTDSITFVAWIKGWKAGDWAPLISSRVVNATEMNFGDNDTLHYTWNGDNANTWGWAGGPVIPQDSWAMLAVTMDPTQGVAYVYTEEGGLTQATNAIAHIEQTVGALQIGYSYDPRYVQGIMDEVAVYSRALTEEEILALTMGPKDPALASFPSPGHDASDIPRDTVLTWGPGEYAQTHNVYFGTDMDEITNATVPTSAGQTANTYDPGRLEFGQAYYWRVDEVNGTPDKTVFKGDIWSFTAEPYSIMIPVDVNHVTASSSTAKNPPSTIVDGSGLDGTTHSSNQDDMWLSGSPDMAPWLMFEFERAQKLDKMLIWNSNSSSEAFIGWSIKDVSIEYSLDGADWTVLEGATQISRGPGLPTYNEPHVVDFGLAHAKYVKINIVNNWGGILMQYAVAEVQFYGLPVFARTPVPVPDAVNVRPDAIATWRAGREAGQHTVSVDVDPNAVIDGSAPSASSMTSSTDLGSFDLQMETTYFWKVDEVNDAEVPSLWAGPVWSFDTAAALTVDDFESYGNKSPNRPFQAWSDGYGYSADEYFPEYLGNGTGAGIGHDIWSPGSPQFGGQIMETVSTIQGSTQSMPFYYTNTGGVASQTERIFSPAQDWTVGSAKTLSIAFRGQIDNTGTLYVKINNVKVTYPRDPGNIAKSVWQAWNIDLASVNTNLESVTKLAIGVDGSSASGMVLIDDITLHAKAGELITPVQPASGSLILHYTFDAGAGASIVDASGKGNTGTFEILPEYDTGVSGSAASFNGSSNYVSAPAAVWSSVSTQFTLSFWAKGDPAVTDNWAVFAGNATSRIVSCHLPWGSEVVFDTTADWANERIMVGAAPDELSGQWRHWTFVRNVDTGEKKIYMDGILYGSATPSADPIINVDRFFIGAGDAVASPYTGLIDDFQIYNRALSAEEILWLAGVTTPIDKPF